MDPISERIVPATDANIARAADLITQGKLVAFPTETVYGLGADATNERAVANLFAAKDRPTFNPLIVHLAEPADAETLVRFNDLARVLAETFWPGALTMVLPRATDSPVSLLVSAGLDSLAVRVPDHAAALALLGRAGRPIAAPSANRAGTVSPTNADHVAISLGERVDMVLDAGPCRIGLESTVIDLTGERPVLLRPGGIAQEVIEAAIETPLMPSRGDDASRPAKSPGLMGRHYAPHRAPAPGRRGRRARRGPARLRPAGAPPRRPQPQPQGRSGGSGGQPVRHGAASRSVRGAGDRRHAHSRAGPGPGDQRPPAPGGGARRRQRRRQRRGLTRRDGKNIPYMLGFPVGCRQRKCVK